MLNELIGNVNPTLRERINKLIVRKLIDTKFNLGFGAPLKQKKTTIY